MQLEKYTFGVGDRFSHQGKAQLTAMIKAAKAGIEIVPVWNKSHREHSIINTSPADVRSEADAAVKELAWSSSYYVDAYHINLGNVDGFIEHSDFFTLDVADYTGQKAEQDAIDEFVRKYSKYAGPLKIDGIDDAFDITAELITEVAYKYLYAVQEAGKIYRHVAGIKGEDNFVTEVSMDETDMPHMKYE